MTTSAEHGHVSVDIPRSGLRSLKLGCWTTLCLVWLATQRY